MQNFQVEIKALQLAQQKLDQCREDLKRYLADTDELRRSVPKSTSAIHDPVADKLNEVFAHRADRTSGVRWVLDGYLRELDSVRAAIARTLAAYDKAEQDAVARYRKEVR